MMAAAHGRNDVPNLFVVGGTQAATPASHVVGDSSYGVAGRYRLVPNE